MTSWALAKRMREINPAVSIEAKQEFFTAESADALLATKFDYVVDAIDTLANKAFLITECKRRQLRVITSGGAGGKKDGTAVRVTDLATLVGLSRRRFIDLAGGASIVAGATSFSGARYLGSSFGPGMFVAILLRRVAASSFPPPRQVRPARPGADQHEPRMDQRAQQVHVLGAQRVAPLALDRFDQLAAPGGAPIGHASSLEKLRAPAC